VTDQSVWSDLCMECQDVTIRKARMCVSECKADAKMVSGVLISFVQGTSTVGEFAAGLTRCIDSAPGAVVEV